MFQKWILILLGLILLNTGPTITKKNAHEIYLISVENHVNDQNHEL